MHAVGPMYHFTAPHLPSRTRSALLDIAEKRLRRYGSLVHKPVHFIFVGIVCIRGIWLAGNVPGAAFYKNPGIRKRIVRAITCIPGEVEEEEIIIIDQRLALLVFDNAFVSPSVIC